LRVVHVITHLDAGGATEAALYACAHVDRSVFATTLVGGPAPDPSASLEPRAEHLGVPVVTVPALARPVRPGPDGRAYLGLRQVLSDLRPDVVHTHGSKAGILARLAARSVARRPFVVHTVHGWSFHDHMSAAVRAAYVALERAAARVTDRIVTVSRLDRDKGLAAGIGTLRRYVVIRELNDLGPFLRAADAGLVANDAARTALGLPVDVPVVGTVGRLAPQKDPATFVRAAATLARQVPAAHFVMVGGGPDESEVMALARQLGIDGRVVLAGHRDDVPALLPAFDVFLLTSRWEGLPLVLPQAMAAGVPVVATAADGNREIVVSGENGLLVPVGAPEAAARAVMRVLTDDALRERLVAGGRQTAEAYALETTVPQLEALYSELLVTRPYREARSR